MFSRRSENDRGELQAFQGSPSQRAKERREGGREEEESSLMIIAGLRPSS